MACHWRPLAFDLEQVISRLRTKLGPHISHGFDIRAVRGQGYQLGFVLVVKNMALGKQIGFNLIILAKAFEGFSPSTPQIPQLQVREYGAQAGKGRPGA